MFAGRYFNARSFAPRYFAKVGGDAPAVTRWVALRLRPKPTYALEGKPALTLRAKPTYRLED
jgi:hypothetical protein